MDDATRLKLLEIGRRFYEVHAETFDATRRRPWPGWDRVLAHLDVDADGGARVPLRVLDVGCGNGRFAEHLSGRTAHPERIQYLGIDSSATLLDAARQALAESPLGSVSFRRADAFELDADARKATFLPGPFDLIVLFGVLHHLPGNETRRRLLVSLARRLAAGGVLAVTIWRLDRDEERLERLRIPWEAWNEGAPAELHLDPEDLEPGDALLGWRGETETPRYVHFPTDEEIEALERRVVEAGVVEAGVVDNPGVERIDRFYADGPKNDPPKRGDNLYLVFRRAADDAARTLSRGAC